MTDKSPVEQIKELAPQAKIEMLENEVKNLVFDFHAWLVSEGYPQKQIDDWLNRR